MSHGILEYCTDNSLELPEPLIHMATVYWASDVLLAKDLQYYDPSDNDLHIVAGTLDIMSCNLKQTKDQDTKST